MPDLNAKTVIVTNVTLINLDVEIAEREQYRSEQETIIKGLVNDGNNYLLSINYDIEVAKKELKETKAKLYELSREKYQAQEDLNQLREDIKAELNNSGLSPSFGV